MSRLECFDTKSKLKKTIKNQGNLICRGQIYQEIINNALNEFKIGFANVIDKAQIGQSKRSGDQVQITSFCLLTVIESPLVMYKELHIKLICGMENKHGEATKLLQHVIEYAGENNYNRVSLHSLNEESLLNWYLKNRFRIIETICQGSEIKAVSLAIDLQ